MLRNTLYLLALLVAGLIGHSLSGEPPAVAVARPALVAVPVAVPVPAAPPSAPKPAEPEDPPSPAPSLPRDTRGEREQLVDRLAASGPAAGAPVLDEARRRYAELARGHAEVTVSSATCYRGGCTAELRFRTAGEPLQLQQRLFDEIAAVWTGPASLTGPEPQADGTLSSQLLLYVEGEGGY